MLQHFTRLNNPFWSAFTSPRRHIALANQFIRLLLLGAACTSVASCTTVRQATLKAGPNDGLVVLSLSSNLGGHIPQFSEITLARADGTKAVMFSLENTEPEPSIERDTKLFIGAVPAGSYVIQSFHSFRNIILHPQLADGAPDVFRVEAGRTSDLGRIVVTETDSPDGLLVGRTAIASNKRLDSDLPVSWKNALTNALPTPWVEDVDPQIEQIALRRPQGFTGFSADSEVVYSGARLGAVMKRDKGGQWQVLGRSSSLLSVLTTTIDSDGTVVAAGEFGTLFRIDQSGAVHDLDRGNLPSGDIVFIDHSPDHTQWLVAIQDSQKLAVLVSSQVDGGTWHMGRSEPFEWGFWEQIDPLTAWRNNNGVTIVSTVSSTITCYDWKNKTWQTNPSPNGVIQNVVRGAGDTFGIGTTGGFYGETYIISDCGRSWSEIDSPHTARATAGVPFRAGDDYAWVEGDAWGSATATFFSTNAGRTWKQTSERSVEPANVWFHPESKLIFAVSTEKEYVGSAYGAPGHEKILVSKDNGISWQEEFK